MRTFQIIIACVVATAVSSQARADEPKTSVCITSAVVYPTSFEGKALGPSVLHGVSALVPVAYRWSLVLKAVMATPTTVFQPAPQGAAGVATKLTNSMLLGATALYRYVPYRSGMTGDAHLVGVALGPSIPLPSKIALGFSTGATRNITAKANSFFFGFELGFPLPI
jgi:hypothetical protein